MNFHNNLKVSLALVLGLSYSAAQAVGPATVAGAAFFLPKGIELATDAVGNIATYQLVGKETNKKISLNLYTATGIGFVSTMAKQMQSGKQDMPHPMSPEGKERPH